MIICLLMLWIIFAESLRAQQGAEGLISPHLLTKESIARNDYIAPLTTLKNLESKYLAAPQWKISYLERIIQLENFVSNYDKARVYEKLLYQNLPSTKAIADRYKKEIPNLKSSPVANYRKVDAVEAIASVAEKHQVVMINEEHRAPFHRALTRLLLEKLYARGFRFFALETVTENEADLNKRGYPTQATGYYSADPVYADLIRTALKLGFKIVPYESMDSSCESPAKNPEFCNDKREREQAQNLYNRILKKEPHAKILVHVGRSHNSKSAVSEEFNFMAYYFQQISKIEPFTIDQLNFSERPFRELEQPLYRLLTKNKSIETPIAFQAGDGKFYNQGFGYDMVIFHPRMRYVNGRAAFLKMNGLRKSEHVNLKKLKISSMSYEPVLIQAFYADESIDAVPVDQFITDLRKPIQALMLPKGKFRIRALNKAGNILGEYIR
jgi:hypothetical protein